MDKHGWIIGAVGVLVLGAVYLIASNGGDPAATTDNAEKEVVIAVDAPGYGTISAERVLEMLEMGEDFLLVDVRTPEEYDEGHIAGAI